MKKRFRLRKNRKRLGDRWGASCLILEESESIEEERTSLTGIRKPTKKHSCFQRRNSFLPAGKKPLKLENQQNLIWSPDEKKLLIYTNTQKVWRVNSRGDYWVLDLETFDLRQLGSEFEEATLMFAKFSPNSNRVAYVQDRDIYVEDLESGRIKKLTTRQTESIINGTTDWVYEEEFQIRDGFAWSPDGKSIAYLQFHTEGVGTFHLTNYLAGKYPTVNPLPTLKWAPPIHRCG